MSSKTKKQHFVPQFLLRNFTDSKGKLWVYDKSTGRSFQTGTDNVACDGYFYDDAKIAEVTGKEQFVERALAVAEGRWSTVVSKVLRRIRNCEYKVITDEERVELSQMMAVQMIRTPLVRADYEQMKAVFVNKARQSAGKERDINDSTASASRDFDKVDARHIHISSMLEHERVLNYQNIFLRHYWFFSKAAGHGSYYLSDHPLGRRPHKTGSGWQSYAGIASQGIEIAFPLAHDVVLSMFERTYFPQAMVPQRGWKNETSPEGILYHNCFQVKSSLRFLYSLDNDFTHAETICKDEPNLRDPSRQLVFLDGK